MAMDFERWAKLERHSGNNVTPFQQQQRPAIDFLQHGKEA
jgi:hypothetical protein